jgi:hypothetical protein
MPGGISGKTENIPSSKWRVVKIEFENFNLKRANRWVASANTIAFSKCRSVKWTDNQWRGITTSDEHDMRLGNQVFKNSSENRDEATNGRLDQLSETGVQ